MFHSSSQGSRSFSNSSNFGTQTLITFGSQPFGKAGGSFSEVMLPSYLMAKVWPSLLRRQFMNSLAAFGLLEVLVMPSA